MVNASVASSSLSSNDISSLANILEVSFHHQKKHNTPFTEEWYVKRLTAIAGLSFTTILVEGSLVFSNRPHFLSFISNLERTERGKDYIHFLVHDVANLIAGANFPFSLLDLYDHCYGEWLADAVRSLLSHVSIMLEGKEEEARRLLSLLFKKRWQVVR